jgi:tetratricopeptide (TPR) repeat protein
VDAQSLCRQAAALHQRGRAVEAERLYLHALAIEPNNAQALNLLGVLRLQGGRREEGEELIRGAIRADPDLAGAHLNLGILMEELGRPAEALASYDRALELKPDLVPARFCRGNVRNALGRFEEALADYDWVAGQGLADAALLNNRGSVLHALGRGEEALASYGKAAEAAPGNAAIWKNQANLMREQHRYAEALVSYERAIRLGAGDAESWDEYGMALHGLKRFDEAMTAFEHAIAAGPHYAPAWFHKALEYLTRGELEKGWPLWEWRQKLPAARLKHFTQPLWRGEDINGKTLFVWWEEGLGDAIQFFRFCLAARERGAKVVFSAPAPLIRLFRDARAGVEIIGSEAAPEQFDYHIPLLSLPFAFHTRLETIPAPSAYLRVQVARTRAWKKTIGAHGLRIGVTWAATKDRALGRSFPLAELKRLSELPGVRLIALQKHHGLEELGSLPPGMKVESFRFDEGDDAFLDTPAMMANMDLIISADTSSAHLAGALGLPCWVALKHVADWRWFLDRGDSPWYPSLRLFRQKTEGDWAGVFAEMTEILAAVARKIAGPDYSAGT